MGMGSLHMENIVFSKIVLYYFSKHRFNGDELLRRNYPSIFSLNTISNLDNATQKIYADLILYMCQKKDIKVYEEFVGLIEI